MQWGRHVTQDAEEMSSCVAVSTARYDMSLRMLRRCTVVVWQCVCCRIRHVTQDAEEMSVVLLYGSMYVA